MKFSYIIPLAIIIMASACGDSDKNAHTDTASTKHIDQAASDAPYPSKHARLFDDLAFISEYEPAQSSPLLAIFPVIEKTVQQLQDTKVLEKIDFEANRCFLSIDKWKQFDRQHKQYIARCLAYYCGIKRDVAPLYWVELVSTDMKLLCKYVHNRYCEIYV
jgi:hypothetical protein